MHDEEESQNRDELPSVVVGTGGFADSENNDNTNDTAPGYQSPEPEPLGPDGPFSRLKQWVSERATKKRLIITCTAFVLLLGGTMAFALTHHTTPPKKPPVVAKQAPSPPAPKPVIRSPLTGVPVSESDAQRPVTGVMIENSDFARPQSGLGSAGVVFEAIAEAGITRFLALYQEAQPGNIGPVRSVRPYFLQWDMGFDASIAHVGGSPEALNDINAWHARDIGEFTYGSYYHRISSREAPHNMYTSIANLNAIEKLRGWTTSTFTGFPRKPDAPAQSPSVTTIDLNPSWSDFAVHYQYDAKNNAYLRWLAGAKHIDANTGKQLEPKVVIAIVLPYSIEADGYHSRYGTIGSGRAYVLQDGTVTVGIWKKTSNTGQIQFLDTSGKPIDLNTGQTWITALGSASQIRYQGPAKPKQ